MVFCARLVPIVNKQIRALTDSLRKANGISRTSGVKIGVVVAGMLYFKGIYGYDVVEM